MLRLNFKSTMIYLITLIMVSTVVYAQGPRGMGLRDGTGRGFPGRLHQMKCDKMIVYLDLDADKDKKFLDMHADIIRDIDLKIDEIDLATKKLHYAIDNGSSDLKSKVTNLENLHSDLDALQDKLNKMAKAELTELKYAKYLIFEHQFRKELRQSLMQRRVGEGYGRKGGR